MATIKYKCDICTREIELLENKVGMTTFSNCIITNNCKGNLYAVKRNANNVRETIPSYDTELDDYIPRPFFVKYIQKNESLSWVIEHGFGPSCVIVVYDVAGNIVDNDQYGVITKDGITTLTINYLLAGTAHIISRTGGKLPNEGMSAITSPTQVSFADILTFAVPKYITRYDSGADPNVAPLPALPAPLDLSSATIRIEIEVIKPNEPAVTCDETLEAISQQSTWYNWPEILIKSRKQYSLRYKKISEFKIFSNTNDGKVTIPDGTILKIKRIDYGNGIFVNIPDRGLIVLLTNPPYTAYDKELTMLVECGEMVNSPIPYFSFDNSILYVDYDVVEHTYPKISKYL